MRDNGVGLPAGFDWRQAGSSLGPRRVRMLAGQLDGTADARDEKGKVFEISFGAPSAP